MVVLDLDRDEFNELQDICDYLLKHDKYQFSLKLVLLLRELQQGVFYDDFYYQVVSSHLLENLLEQ